MKIKVCGMRDSENIKGLVKLSPDYIGFIFYEKSKRHVSGFPKVDIPNSIKKVGVFVNESIDKILDSVQKNKLNVIQLHGDESVQYCKRLINLVAEKRSLSGVETSRSDNKLGNTVISTPLNFQIEIIKAFSVDEQFDFNRTKDYEAICDLFIFDTKGKNYGGNGIKYDWNILKNYQGETPFLLSGGIGVDDIEAVKDFQHKKCVGVDLNSGFEDTPGIKNIEKLKTFLRK